ncbi:hypothetical protein [Morganella morganii]|uniref:hypothetical protein n=1 Tax=Morganella morganii TaxID=582 RepID=UPI00189A4449|nr:hypothetical protein [Morganella morganii]
MMKRNVLFLSVVVLLVSGCAARMPVIKGVDCVAYYCKGMPLHPVYTLHLLKEKNDSKTHQRKIWHKQAGGGSVKFVGRWISDNILEEVKCQISE